MTRPRMNQELTGEPDYQQLLGRISEVYRTGQSRAYQAANRHLTETYWQIGHDIVEYEQGGQVRAEYGKELLSNLSRDLKRLHGRGFSRSNLVYMRLLYVNYPISQKPSDLLSWSHYVELLRVSDPLERGFYEQQAIREKWSVPELQRQKKSSLFLRLAAGKNKDEILSLATQGQIISQPTDLFREPYVFEFMTIPEHSSVTEKKLETLLCDHLQPFLLELGKGFTFFAAEENVEGDNPPIGIILSREKDELLVEYATYEMNSQLFVQKYQLYLPDRGELRREIENTLRIAEQLAEEEEE